MLHQLSLEAGVPLPIAQTLLIGIPSGTITVRYPKPAPIVDLRSITVHDPTRLPSDLLQARALYWEGLASSSPFHAFLCFWKVYELVTAARGRWSRQRKQKDARPIAETMPDVWAWSGLAGMTFAEARHRMEQSFRHAIAHADSKRTPAKTSATLSDLASVSDNLATVRYMAEVVVRNFQATILKELDRAATTRQSSADGTAADASIRSGDASVP
ncbi:MAG: methylamine utilization protein MauJ [Longimicrobiales bacterium]